MGPECLPQWGVGTEPSTEPRWGSLGSLGSRCWQEQKQRDEMTRGVPVFFSAVYDHFSLQIFYLLYFYIQIADILVDREVLC